LLLASSAGRFSRSQSTDTARCILEEYTEPTKNSYIELRIVGAQLIMSAADIKFSHENVFPKEYQLLSALSHVGPQSAKTKCAIAHMS